MTRLSLISTIVSCLFLIPMDGFSQGEKMQGAVDLYMPPPIKVNKIKELKVGIRKPEQEGEFLLIQNKYNANGNLIDSVDAQGDHHFFAFDDKNRLAEYTFVSNSFEYERMTGEPEFRQSKRFFYNKKGKLIQLLYFQMDSLSHTVDFEVDKKGRTLSYHSKDQFGDPSFYGYYTYTKFDSVATFVDYTSDSTPILYIDYTYNKKKQPISKVERGEGTPTKQTWTFSNTLLGDSTSSESVTFGSTDEGLETLLKTQQTLVRKLEKGKLVESRWEYAAVEFPVAEAHDSPTPNVLDRMTGYFEQGKCRRISFFSEGEADKIGSIEYDDQHGLISELRVMDATTNELLFTVHYQYVFF